MGDPFQQAIIVCMAADARQSADLSPNLDFLAEQPDLGGALH